MIHTTVTPHFIFIPRVSKLDKQRAKRSFHEIFDFTAVFLILSRLILRQSGLGLVRTALSNLGQGFYVPYPYPPPSPIEGQCTLYRFHDSSIFLFVALLNRPIPGAKRNAVPDVYRSRCCLFVVPNDIYWLDAVRSALFFCISLDGGE